MRSTARPSFFRATGPRFAVALVLAFSVSSCTDSGGGPLHPGPVSASLALGAVFSGVAADGAAPVNRIAARVIAEETGDVLAETTVDVDPDESAWEVSIEVEISGSTRVVVEFELLNVPDQGEPTVVYSGRTEPVLLEPGAVTEIGEDEVEVVRGPADNLDVTGLEIATAPPVLLEGETVTLEAVVEGAENPEVFWSLAAEDEAAGVAAVESGGATSAVVSGLETGTVTVVAEAGRHRDSVRVRVTFPAFLVPLTPGEVEAPGGATIEEAPTVRVLDELEEPVPGVEVAFATGDFGGLNGDRASISGETAVTDEEGRAAVPGSWTLGIRSGTYTLTVSVEGAEPLEFHATALPSLAGVTDVEAGQSHTCALNGAGEAFCWGSNSHGQIGNTAVPLGSAVQAPVPVEGGHLFTRFAGSIFFTTCALDPEGALFCWGRDPNLTGEILPVPTSDHVLGGPLFREYALGFEHSCGITVTGEALCIGRNEDGQLGDPDAASFSGYVAPEGGIDFVSISPAFLTTCGLASDGTVYCWGTDSFGALGDGEPVGNRADTPQPVQSPRNGSFTSFAGGTEYACATTEAGETHCWGLNRGAQTGIGQDPVERPVVAQPEPVAGSTPFFELALATENSILLHACGMDSNDALHCWGTNDSGQLGAASTDVCDLNGTLFDCSWQPTPVAGGLTAVDVTLGIRHTCAATAADEVLCWGANASGQLGDGSTTDSTDPVVVLQPRDAAEAVVVGLRDPAGVEPDVRLDRVDPGLPRR